MNLRQYFLCVCMIISWPVLALDGRTLNPFDSNQSYYYHTTILSHDGFKLFDYTSGFIEDSFNPVFLDRASGTYTAIDVSEGHQLHLMHVHQTEERYMIDNEHLIYIFKSFKNNEALSILIHKLPDGFPELKLKGYTYEKYPGELVGFKIHKIDDENTITITGADNNHGYVQQLLELHSQLTQLNMPLFHQLGSANSWNSDFGRIEQDLWAAVNVTYDEFMMY